MRIFIIGLIGSLLITLSSFIGLQTAFAFNIFTQPDSSGNSGVDCSGPAQGSTVCAEQGTTSDPITGAHGYLEGITNIVAIVAGIAAVILLIVGGIRYITSAGDAGKIKSARDTIAYALVGIVVIVVARILITYVVNRL